MFLSHVRLGWALAVVVVLVGALMSAAGATARGIEPLSPWYAYDAALRNAQHQRQQHVVNSHHYGSNLGTQTSERLATGGTLVLDWFERYAAAHPYGFNLGTQTSERLATGGTVVLDWFERYAAAHPYGSNLGTQTSERLATGGTVVLDWVERYAAAHPYGSNLGTQ